MENRIVENDRRPKGLNMVLIHRNQDADQVLRQARENNMRVQDNINNIIERVSIQNNLNVGLHRTKYISPLLEYVRQSEFPRGWKVPNSPSSLAKLVSPPSDMWPSIRSGMVI